MELLISISLFAVIILGVTAFNVGSRFFLESVDRKVKVLNEVTLILHHIDRNMKLAVGDIDTPAVNIVNPTTVQIRQDVSYVAGYPQPRDTPENTTDDNWIEYVVGPAWATAATFAYCPDVSVCNPVNGVGYSILSERLVRVGVVVDDVYFSQNVPNEMLRIHNLALLYDPAATRDLMTNPQSTAHTTVVFNSFSHSVD